MDRALSIFRYAVRGLGRSPLLTVIIVLCLTLGIGANTAIFSVVNTLLLRPLPVQDVDRLAFVLDMRGDDDPYEAALLTYLALKRSAPSLVSVGVAHRESFRLTGGDLPERIEAAAISLDYLSTLGVEPILGRNFSPEDARLGGPPVVLVGHALWERRFARDPSLVGSQVLLGDQSYTVIGILPPSFDLPLGTELWVPLGLDFETLPMDQQAAHDYLMVARLKPGVSFQQANVEARGIARQLQQAHPEHRRGWGIKLIPLRQQILGDINGHIRPTLLLLLAIVAFLLLIACGNVASLLLARSMEQSQDVAVQTAMGATRRHLMGQLMTESVLLSLIGGGLGLLVAYFVTSPLMALSPVSAFALKGVLQEIQMDVRVLGFTLVVSLLTGVLFGLAPAAQVGMPGNLVLLLKEGGRGGSGGRMGRRILNSLVVGEMAAAVTLVVGAGLLVKSFQRLSDAELGFQPHRLLAVEVFLSDLDYPEHHQRVAFVEEVLAGVRSLPGVRSAGVSTNIPLSIATWDASYTVEGKPPVDTSEVPITAHRVVTPGYLETLGVSLVGGRLINSDDREGSLSAVVISEEFARRAWPGEDPLGKRVKPGYPAAESTPWYTVVGVVKDVKEDRFNFRIDRPVWYMSYLQRQTSLPIYLLVRSEGDPLRLVDSIRNIIWAANKNQPISNVTTVEAHLDEFLGPQRFGALLSGMFAVLGLVLAAVGLYGVMSYSVNQRTQEFGIRMALGAKGGDLIRLVIRWGLLLTAIGLGVGLLGSAVLARVLTSLLYQVRPGDPSTFVTATLILLLVGLVAAYFPASRTARLDPNIALRYE